MPAADSAIARKHIELSIEIKKTTNRICKDLDVYLATHAISESYRKIEKESGDEFWSIKARTPTSYQPLKDPDIIIADDKQVRLIVEVKWGTVPGSASTDLRMTKKEWGKIYQFLGADAMCRVRGPAVKGGVGYPSAEFPIERDYLVDRKTLLVLVSDFRAVAQKMGSEMNAFIRLWKTANNVRFLIADRDTRLGEIPAFQVVLKEIG